MLGLCLLTLLAANRAGAETGYDLWLRYLPLQVEAQRLVYRRSLAAVVIEGRSPTARTIREEDGSIERGYAGPSLWTWSELPDRVDPRVLDYARANASIGINGAVINAARTPTAATSWPMPSSPTAGS